MLENIKTFFGTIILFSLLLFLLLSLLTEPIIIKEEFDIIEYDVSNQFFIYADENNNINKISWDESGWNNDASNVNVIQSDRLYMERIMTSNKIYSNSKYILYINKT